MVSSQEQRATTGAHAHSTDVEAIPPQEELMEVDDGKEVRCPASGCPNKRRRIAERPFPAEAQTSSSAVAITAREGIDWYRVKAMRIAIVEPVELGSTMELSVSGHVLRWARQIKNLAQAQA